MCNPFDDFSEIGELSWMFEDDNVQDFQQEKTWGEHIHDLDEADFDD